VFIGEDEADKEQNRGRICRRFELFDFLNCFKKCIEVL
jgi:hypothetical protein